MVHTYPSIVTSDMKKQFVILGRAGRSELAGFLLSDFYAYESMWCVCVSVCVCVCVCVCVGVKTFCHL